MIKQNGYLENLVVFQNSLFWHLVNLIREGLTHWLRGVNLPVRAFNTSWATIPPMAAVRGTNDPCAVYARLMIASLSRGSIGLDNCALSWVAMLSNFSESSDDLEEAKITPSFFILLQFIVPGIKL